jgi:hypothetical protein
MMQRAPRRRSNAVPLAAVLATTITALAAHPAAAQVHLEVEEPEPCVSSRLPGTLAGLVGPLEARAADEVRVRVSGDRVEITIAEASGEAVGARTLERAPRDCAARSDAVALVVSILLEDRASAPALDLAHYPIAEPPPSAVASPAPEPARRAPDVRVRFEVGVAVAFGWLAELSAGPRARGSFGVEGWGIGLGAELSPESIAGRDLAVLMRSIVGTLDLETPALAADVVALSGLARLVVGALQGLGRGGVTNYDRLEPTLRADLVARAELRFFGTLGITLEAGLFVSIVRPQFVALIGADRVALHIPNEVGPVGSVTLTLGPPP